MVRDRCRLFEPDAGLELLSQELKIALGWLWTVKYINQMSDMLQLVVEIGNAQAMTLPVTRTLRVRNLDDKLKHVGHLVSRFFQRLGLSYMPL